MSTRISSAPPHLAVCTHRFSCPTSAPIGPQTDALGLPIETGLLVAILFTFTALVLAGALLFFLSELSNARTILLHLDTHQPPALELEATRRWHLFLSHNWANQDVVSTIKLQLTKLLPDARIFLE
jgi:hypothetical protein